MTAILDLPADLADYDFDVEIPCGWPRCQRTGVKMIKACGDEHYMAICPGHLISVECEFESCKPAVCSICSRPFMHFETHYSVLEI